MLLTRHTLRRKAQIAVLTLILAGCGGAPPRNTSPTPQDSVQGQPAATISPSAPAVRIPAGEGAPGHAQPLVPSSTVSAFQAGNPAGRAAIPAEANPANTRNPHRVIGTGTAASCTSEAVVDAVAAGGVITFSCGSSPVTIVMKATAKIRNANAQTVLDGGGLVTLSGGGMRRILYQNTCDQAQGWSTSHCQDQETPQLTLQNLTFARGNSTGQTAEGGGGGAVFVRGGRIKIVHTRFVGNRCDPSGPDLGGAAVRVLSQSKGRPVYVVNSTFEGGKCSNGAALSSIGVSWIVLNSVFENNDAIGKGANPARAGNPGGGSGGAIYTDGNQFMVTIADSVLRNNTATEGGGAIFFVSNNRTGTLRITGSNLTRNPSAGFETKGYPGIFFLGAGTPVVQD